MKPRVLVIGSINMDLVIRAPRLPLAGETLRGEGFLTSPGGKGANQAVAASRMGGQVRMVGRVGEDVFGPALVKSMVDCGVDTSQLLVSPGSATGIAMILLDPDGQNRILIDQGANLNVTPDAVRAQASLFDDSDVLLLQLEIPMETIAEAIRLAKERGLKIVLDAGPPTPIPRELLQGVDVLSPNETEAAVLLGHEIEASLTPDQLIDVMLAAGVGAVVLKLGEQGCLIATPEKRETLPAHRVSVVDTTGAGDAFTGALAVALGEGKDLRAAARIANAAGALAVTKLGAQGSMPTRAEVETLLGRI